MAFNRQLTPNSKSGATRALTLLEIRRCSRNVQCWYCANRNALGKSPSFPYTNRSEPRYHGTVFVANHNRINRRHDFDGRKATLQPYIHDRTPYDSRLSNRIKNPCCFISEIAFDLRSTAVSCALRGVRQP